MSGEPTSDRTKIILGLLGTAGVIVPAMIANKIWPFDGSAAVAVTPAPLVEETPAAVMADNTVEAPPPEEDVIDAAPSPAVESPTPEAPGGILANNKCDQTVTFKIVYEHDGGWDSSANATWDFAPGLVSFPTYQDHRLRPKGGIFYIWARKEDGTSVTTDESSFEGVPERLQKVEAGTDQNGDYGIDFCST